MDKKGRNRVELIIIIGVSLVIGVSISLVVSSHITSGLGKECCSDFGGTPPPSCDQDAAFCLPSVSCAGESGYGHCSECVETDPNMPLGAGLSTNCSVIHNDGQHPLWACIGDLVNNKPVRYCVDCDLDNDGAVRNIQMGYPPANVCAFSGPTLDCDDSDPNIKINTCELSELGKVKCVVNDETHKTYEECQTSANEQCRGWVTKTCPLDGICTEYPTTHCIVGNEYCEDNELPYPIPLGRNCAVISGTNNVVICTKTSPDIFEVTTLYPCNNAGITECKNGHCSQGICNSAEKPKEYLQYYEGYNDNAYFCECHSSSDCANYDPKSRCGANSKKCYECFLDSHCPSNPPNYCSHNYHTCEVGCVDSGDCQINLNQPSARCINQQCFVPTSNVPPQGAGNPGGSPAAGATGSLYWIIHFGKSFELSDLDTILSALDGNNMYVSTNVAALRDGQVDGLDQLNSLIEFYGVNCDAFTLYSNGGYYTTSEDIVDNNGKIIATNSNLVYGRLLDVCNDADNDGNPDCTELNCEWNSDHNGYILSFKINHFSSFTFQNQQEPPGPGTIPEFKTTGAVLAVVIISLGLLFLIKRR